MQRIERPPIIAGWAWIVAAVLDRLLVLAMARRAQRLQLAQPERIPVATMRLDVVGDGGDRRDATRSAHAAERFAAELRLGTSTPAADVVPVAPRSLAIERVDAATSHSAAI